MSPFSSDENTVEVSGNDGAVVATIQLELRSQITQYGVLSTRNSQSCLACLAGVIVNHLNELLSYKKIINNQSLRLVYCVMLEDWKRIKVIHSQNHTGGHHPTYFH